MVVTLLQLASVLCCIGALAVTYWMGRKDGWRAREEAYEAACHTLPDAIERSKR